MSASHHDHSALLARLNRESPKTETLTELAELFKLFGDPTRIRILYALWESEMCVCALAEHLSMTQSAISHQLRALRDGRLVGSRREGKTMIYYLSDEHVRTIIGQGYGHLTEEGGEAK